MSVVEMDLVRLLDMVAIIFLALSIRDLRKHLEQVEKSLDRKQDRGL